MNVCSRRTVSRDMSSEKLAIGPYTITVAWGFSFFMFWHTNVTRDCMSSQPDDSAKITANKPS